MKNSKLKTRYIIGDIAALLVAWFAFNIFRYNLLPLEEIYGSFFNFVSTPRVIGAQIAFPTVFFIIFHFSGYYNMPLFKSRVNDLFTSIFSVAIGVITILFMSLLNKYIYTEYNYTLVLALFTIVFTLVYSVRVFTTSSIAKLIHSGKIGFRALIIGDYQKATELKSSLYSNRYTYGYNVLGFIPDKDILSDNNEEIESIAEEEIQKRINRDNINILIVSPASNRDSKRSLAIINSLYRYDLPILLEVNELELLTTKVKLGNIRQTPLVDVTVCSMSECEKNIKRFLDVVCSAMALIVLSPLFLFIYFKIKSYTNSSVIYSQKRVGYRKKEFSIYKFRSMRDDAEFDNTPKLADYNDPRITKFGNWMRRYRVDELPQFWNVIKGDMSIVGPRPERQFFIDKIIKRAPYYSLLHQVRPGITSLGMINFGYARNVNEMVKRLRFDIIYLENMSLTTDIKIVIYTIKIVFSGRGI